MVHVAVVGNGKVGGEVAFSLVFERYVTELSLVDIAPGVAEMTKEEFSHAVASHALPVKINAYDNSTLLKDADLIVIAAGFSRTPDMSRRALADRNAQVVKDVVDKTLHNNPDAWYFVITNPVDAMATLANKVAQGKRTIIGTGTNLETVRFKTILSRELNVPLSMLEAYTGGEHGEEAVLLWSTVKINGMPLEEYLNKTGKTINKNMCENYVKQISSQIIQALGGTKFGPAGSFIEILRGILLNTGKVVSYGRIRKFDTVPEPVYITVPAIASRSLGPDIWDFLTEKEHKAIEGAACAIYNAYCEAKKATKLTF